MGSLNRITIDPAKMNGQPCIRGMRLTVRRVLEAMAVYPDRPELKHQFPELEDEDIRQALAYAAASLENVTPERPRVPFADALKDSLGKVMGLPPDASSHKRHYLYGHPRSC